MRLRQTFARGVPFCKIFSLSNERNALSSRWIARKSESEIKIFASLAQLDRALVYGTKGQGFESLATHQEKKLRFCLGFALQIARRWRLFFLFRDQTQLLFHFELVATLCNEVYAKKIFMAVSHKNFAPNFNSFLRKSFLLARLGLL